MSKQRKPNQQAGAGGSGRSSGFPVAPVIALAIGAGLYFSFSGILRRGAPTSGADTNANSVPVAPPPKIAGNTNHSPEASSGGTSLTDLMNDTSGETQSPAHEHLNRGTEFYQQGNYAAAVTNYAEAVRLAPEDETAYFNYGSALAKLGRIAEAKAAYAEALKLLPDYAEVHNNLGNLLAGEGRLVDASEHLAAAVKDAPESASARNNYGIVLVRLGKPVEAIAQFQEAVRLMPDYVEAHCNLGNTYYAQGRLTEAEAKFEEALRIKAGFEPAKAGLARVAQARQATPLVPNSPVPLP